MIQIVLTVMIVLRILTGCGDDFNPTLGKWRGQITEDQRSSLSLPKHATTGRVIIEFTASHATLNGKTFLVRHKKNEQNYYINEIGTNRTMAARFKDPNTMELGIPHRSKAKIVVLSMSRITEEP